MVRCIFILFAFFVCGHNFCEWHKSAGLAYHSGNRIGLRKLCLHVADIADRCAALVPDVISNVLSSIFDKLRLQGCAGGCFYSSLTLRNKKSAVTYPSM